MKYKFNKCLKFYMKILIKTFLSFINQTLDSENTCNYSSERSLNDDKMIVWMTFFNLKKWFV